MHRDADIFFLAGQLPLLLPAFALVLFRVAGLMMAAPLFGSSSVPVRVRVLVAFAIALTLFPLVGASVPARLEFGDMVIGVVGEVLIGLAMGTAVGLVIVGAELAGELGGQQAGFSLGQIVNPMSNSESTVFAQIYGLVFAAVFLGVGGHRALVRALLDTFAVIPLGSFRADARMTTLFGDTLTSAFELAVRLAAPVLIAMFLASVALGLLSRSIPQLNILTVGFAIRALLAIAIAAAALTVSEDAFVEALTDMMGVIRSAFGLDPGRI